MFWEHTATHMDVPGHFVAGGRTSEKIALYELVGPIVVVDISERAAHEPAHRGHRATTCAASSAATAGPRRGRSSR